MMQKNITHKKEKLIRINPKLTQMLEVATKDMKRITIMHLISSKKVSRGIKGMKKTIKTQIKLSDMKTTKYNTKNSQIDIEHSIS